MVIYYWIELLFVISVGIRKEPLLTHLVSGRGQGKGPIISLAVVSLLNKMITYYVWFKAERHLVSRTQHTQRIKTPHYPVGGSEKNR